MRCLSHPYEKRGF